MKGKNVGRLTGEDQTKPMSAEIGGVLNSTNGQEIEIFPVYKIPKDPAKTAAPAA